MKKLKLIQALLILIFANASLLAQDDIHPTQKEIGVQFGLSINSIKEERFSAITKKYVQPKFGLVYRKQNDKKRQELLLSFTSSLSRDQPKYLWYKIINPEVSYTYQRKVADFWVGGYYQSSTFLNWAQNDQNSFGNNSIAYTISNNLGIAVDRSLEISSKGKHKFDSDMGVRSTLLSHVIRPHYGHPYPEHFLQEDVFNPTRAGMGKSVAKSGKLRTVNKFWGMNLKLGFNYIYNDKWKMGVQYGFNMLRNNEGKKMIQKAHDVMLGVSYLY